MPARTIVFVGILGAIAVALLFVWFLHNPTPPNTQIDVPKWTAGELWRFRVSRESTTDNIAWFVNGTTSFRGVLSYEIREETANTSRFRYFDVANLNELSGACGLSPPPCLYRNRDFDFPLWDGKEWKSKSAGDDVVDFTLRAYADGPIVNQWTNFTIEKAHLSGQLDGQRAALLIYSPRDRMFSEMTTYRSNSEIEAWTLEK